MHHPRVNKAYEASRKAYVQYTLYAHKRLRISVMQPQFHRVYVCTVFVYMHTYVVCTYNTYNTYALQDALYYTYFKLLHGYNCIGTSTATRERIEEPRGRQVLYQFDRHGHPPLAAQNHFISQLTTQEGRKEGRKEIPIAHDGERQR